MKTIKVHKIVITFFLLFSSWLAACNRGTDASQFINKKDLEKEIIRCQYSQDSLCVLQPSYRKVEQFCSEQKLSAEKCKDIKNDVTRKANELLKEHNKETDKLTEQIKKATGK